MTDSTNTPAPPWSASPSAKTKTQIQRSVTTLLDELAPERVLKRVEDLVGPVEQHRTPTGCVLQAAGTAVTVSWFAEGGSDAALGELHVLVWRGTVARRGATRGQTGATIIRELILRPVDPSPDNCVWLGNDGARYDTAALSAKCLALLQEQISALG